MPDINLLPVIKKSSPPFNVLVVEDNPADVEVLKLLFKGCPTSVELSFASDGVEGGEMILKAAQCVPARLPDLILMDLNLPRKDGRELLRELKSIADVRHVPVIIFSTSSSQREITEAYSLGANAFITKPPDLDDFQKVITNLVNFWFLTSDLPGQPMGEKGKASWLPHSVADRLNF